MDEAAHDESADSPLGEEERLLLESAEFDAPPSDLETRVLAGIHRRRSLEASERRSRPHRSWPGWLAAAMVAAGVVGVAWHLGSSRPLRVEPERVAGGGEASPAGGASPAGASSGASPVAPAPVPPDPCAQRGRAQGQAPLIDDFEDGDDAVRPLEQRRALWRWSRDTDLPGTAPALLPIPRPGATAGNQQAIRVKGGVLRDWGALVEARFEPSCYDASVYAGVAFSARGRGRLFVAPREVSVVPQALGGTCEKDCFNAHLFMIELGDRWQTYEVRWEQLLQRGYNRPALDPSRLHDISFQIHPEDTPYDVWLDDLRFLERR